MTVLNPDEHLVSATGGQDEPPSALLVFPEGGGVVIHTYDAEDVTTAEAAGDPDLFLARYVFTIDEVLELRHALDQALTVATSRGNVTVLPTRGPWRIELHTRRPETGAA
jgi:hypothetical protein